MPTLTRRALLLGTGTAMGSPVPPAAPRPMRGVFMIMATPYTASQALDYEDLAKEAEFIGRCGAHGMVWPQMASEYPRLTKEERLRGMDVLAKAAKGKAALVLGVQAATTAEAVECAEHAERLEPDAVIALPPDTTRSAADFRDYYAALARVARRPLFVQTTGGKGVKPKVEWVVALAREFPHLGYVKEEAEPVLPRMMEFARNRPPIKAVFSGKAGRGMLYEMRLGFDGTMPGGPYPDIYAQIWDLYQAGQHDQARDLFGKMLLLVNLEEQIPGTRLYLSKKRGVFKTTVSRQKEVVISAEAAREIDFCFEALRPYLR